MADTIEVGNLVVRLIADSKQLEAALAAADAAADEYDKVSAEPARLCHRQEDVLSRIHKPVETMQ